MLINENTSLLKTCIEVLIIVIIIIIIIIKIR